MESAGDSHEDGGGAVAGDGGGEGGGGGEGLWRRGWRLGKRIAIAGAVISSAPVVVPPLLLLSVAGLAFSVPFGVLFAGYACMDRIMRYLLPLPDCSPGAPLLEGEEHEGEEEEGREEDGDVQEVEAENGQEEMGNVEQEGTLVEKSGEEEEDPVTAHKEKEKAEETRALEGGQVQEGEGEVMKRVVEDQDGKTEEGPKADEGVILAPGRGEKRAEGIEEVEQGKEGGVALAGATEGRVSAPEEEEKQVQDFKQKSQVKEEETKEEVVPPVSAVEGGVPAPEEGEISREERGTEDKGQVMQLEEKSVEDEVVPFSIGEECIPASRPEDTGAMEKAIEEERQVSEGKEEAVIPANVESISSPEAEEKHDEVKDVEEARVQEEDGVIPVIRVERGSIARSEGKESSEVSPAVVAVSIVEHEIVVEQSSLSPEYTSSTEEKSSDAAEAESAGSLEHPESQGRLDTVKTQGYDEGLYNEEKIWEQIDSIRTIVGYGAPWHRSCTEELKALFLFMGVEPPTSFEGRPGLEDVNDKLRFLKSVIGVK